MKQEPVFQLYYSKVMLSDSFFKTDQLVNQTTRLQHFHKTRQASKFVRPDSNLSPDSDLCHQTQTCVTRLRLVSPDSDLCHQTQTCITGLRLVSPDSELCHQTRSCVTRLRLVSPDSDLYHQTRICVTRLRIVSPDSDFYHQIQMICIQNPFSL